MRLFFVVLAKPLGESSAVHINEENNTIDGNKLCKNELTVFELKKLIRKELVGNEEGSSKANQWTLWKVEDFIEGGEMWKALEDIEDSNTETFIKNKLNGKKLTSAMVLKEVFSKPSSGVIDIIVQPPPLPATTGKGKRPLGDSDKGQISKRAKPIDPNITSTVRKIMEDIMKLDENESSYSNPKSLLSLLYPYLGEKLPIDRFDIDHDGFFTFMGRKKFKQVLEQVNKLRPRGYMKLFVYGTVGYGKSHILSAIACYLFRTGRRVVFLPDYRQLSVDPVDYIKSALFLAYYDDAAKLIEINSCEKFESIIDFCKKLQFKEKLYFIVDQMNALDEFGNTGVSLEIKQSIRRDIDKMADSHFYIMSSSANNKTMLHLMAKQTGELKITLFGGFDEEEMKEWYKHHPDLPAMDEQQTIEDTTGKIPLFLKLLLGHKNFEDALEHLDQQLTLKVKEPMMNFSDLISSTDRWEIHVNLMSAFLTNNYPTDGYGLDDYDHRFFYVENGKCYYVCGLARDCMANYLYGKNRMEIFIDINWIKSFKNNPSVKGFIVEKACLASICKNGIMANKISFKVDHHKFFASTEEIDFSLNERLCTFYLPHKWNQKSIDGLLALYKTDTLYIAPIQITFDKEGHSDFEGAFFSEIWPELKLNISNNMNVKVIFIWITCKNGVDEKVEKKEKKLRNRNVEINPDYTLVVTGFANVNRDIDRYLSQV